MFEIGKNYTYKGEPETLYQFLKEMEPDSTGKRYFYFKKVNGEKAVSVSVFTSTESDPLEMVAV